MRNLALDIFKLLLSLFVVGLHSNFLSDVSSSFNFFLVQGFFRIAVPFFFIINGYYFFMVLSQKNYKKWIIRISILYVIWMLIYSPYFLLNDDNSFISIKKALELLVFGFGHLWYIITLLFSGILLYFMRNKSSIFILIFSSLLFVFGVILQYQKNYLFIGGDNTFLNSIKIYEYRNFLFLGFPFISWGYLINRNLLYKYFTKKSALLYLLLSVSLLLIEITTNYIYTPKNAFDLLLSLPFVCFFLFILVKKINLKTDTKTLSLLANSIYFIHIIPLLIVIKYFDFGSTINTIQIMVYSVILSVILIQINKKTSYLL